jgi:hypothetical protein
MSAIKRFWRYWCENFETAKGGFDMSALIATVSQKQKIKDSLGAYLVQLEDRVLAIKKMTLFEYNKSLKNEEAIESIDLLNEIYFPLDSNLGKAESAGFKSRTGTSAISTAGSVGQR